MIQLSLHPEHTLRLRLLALGLALGFSAPALGQEAASHVASSAFDLHPIGLSLQPGGRSVLAFGLWTQPTRLSGLSVSALMNVSHQGGAGLMLSGAMNGSRFGTFSGVSIAPLVNAYRGTYHGLQVGFVNGARLGRGIVQLGAVASTSELAGAQLSSFVSLTMGRASGLQIAGVNVAGSAKGLVQIGGINAVAGELRGLQLGVYNYTGKLASPQIGLINTAGATSQGVQIGLVNVSREAGMSQVGLVNVLPDTRIQLLAGGGSLTKANLAVRFRRGRAYSQVGLGLGYRSFEGKFSGSIAYHRGLIFPLSSRLSLLGDLGIAHIEDTPLEQVGQANRRYALASRLTLEYSFSAVVGAYLTGGYAYSRRYQRPSLDRYRPIFEAGITLY